MVLGKLPVPGRPSSLDYSRAGAYCTCLDIFSLVYHFSLLFPCLWNTVRYRLIILSQRVVKPKTTNQLLISYDRS